MQQVQQEIIYQKQQDEKKDSFCSRFCKCLSFWNERQKQIIHRSAYQLGIDSPKSSFIGQRKLIVLDLDETLVHSYFQTNNGYDFSIDIIIQGSLFKVYVTVRPGVIEFIEQLNEFYDIIFWTASLREYADPVMDVIDPNRRAIGRLYRESCTPVQFGLTKNLQQLGRDLKDIIIVDNSVISFYLNPENGFQIKDFFFDKSDNELEENLQFFIWISQLPDVRPVTLLYQQFKKSSSNILNTRNVKQINSQGQFLDQKKFSSISRSLFIHKASIFQSNQIVRTLTLSKDEDQELNEIAIREKLGLNSPKNEQNSEQPEQTDVEDKETFVISN